MTHENDESVRAKDTEAAADALASTDVASGAAINAGRRAVTVSFTVISLLGVLFIFGYWVSIDPSIALQRCVGFVAIMVGAHFVGYRIWRRQFSSPQSESMPVDARAMPQTWRTTTSIILVIVGTLFFFLLNGQVFTNSLVFLFCWTTSLVIRVTDPTLRTRKGVHLVWPLFVILLHVALIGWVAVTLPSSYAFQRTFNERSREARAARLKYLPSVSNGDGSYRFTGEQLKKMAETPLDRDLFLQYVEAEWPLDKLRAYCTPEHLWPEQCQNLVAQNLCFGEWEIPIHKGTEHDFDKLYVYVSDDGVDSNYYGSAATDWRRWTYSLNIYRGTDHWVVIKSLPNDFMDNREKYVPQRPVRGR